MHAVLGNGRLFEKMAHSLILQVFPGRTVGHQLCGAHIGVCGLHDLKPPIRLAAF
jgi:hypothetical protein